MDTKTLLSKLRKLYGEKSKHSVYQNIPTFVSDTLGYAEIINERWRGDTARWEYMRNRLKFSKGTILDVGANTGFFTLSLAHEYPETICTAIEGNANHAEYIKLVADYFEMPNVSVDLKYLDYESLEALKQYDTILLYNVLHHAGVDFDSNLVSGKDELFNYLVRYMSKIGEHCGTVVFQIGYNWGGNKQHPVVSLQDDTGKIIYNSRLMIEAGLVIRAIAVPYAREGAIPVFYDNLPNLVVNAANLCDELTIRTHLADLLDPAMNAFSEFYRRPIFVCTSKKNSRNRR